MTIQQLTNNLNSSDSASAIADAPFSESVITQLAAEFFSALPKPNSQGLNLDLQHATQSIAHPPQPKDPVAALSGRIPAIVQQSNLNPNSAQHYIEPTADHPERRILSSSPVIGGAQNPDPSALLNRLHIPSTQHAPSTLRDRSVGDNDSEVQSANPSINTQLPLQNHTTGQSNYYFLDIPQPEQSHLNIQTAQPHNPVTFDHYHVLMTINLKLYSKIGMISLQQQRQVITLLIQLVLIKRNVIMICKSLRLNKVINLLIF